MTQAPLPQRWPAKHPDRIQLYSMATPNGQKIGIALEELELPYEAHKINILEGDQHDPEFRAINPNGKIPAIIDPTGKTPLRIFESGAILIHLANKTGRLLPKDAHGYAETLGWLFFQVGSVGPMFGQFGHFYRFAKDKTTDDYGKERYLAETKRLLAVMDSTLAEREFLAGDDYTIADIANAPWVAGLSFYDPDGKVVSVDEFPSVARWKKQVLERPASVRGVKVCA